MNTQMIPTTEQLKQAVELSEKIDNLKDELEDVLQIRSDNVGKTLLRQVLDQPDGPVKKKKRTMSPIARARIAKAQKARWAKWHRENE